MAKFSITLLFVVLFVFQSFSKEIKIETNQETKFTITQNDYSSLQFSNSIAEIQEFIIKTQEGDFAQLVIPGYVFTNEVGDPKIPVLRKLIEVPFGASFSVNIVSEEFKEFDLSEFGIINQIIPAQPPVSKSIDNPEDLEFIINEATYQTNSYLTTEMVNVTYLGQMRSANLARLEIAPVHYNPVTNKIKVYFNLEVEVTFIGGNTGQTINTKKELFSPFFQSTFNSIVNYKEELSDELIMAEPVTYVIISDPMFETALQPFIQWKTKKGFQVIEAYTNDPGVGTTTTSIKSYLQDLYNNPAPGYNPQSFVLIVGDVAQIPTYSGTAGSHVSDLYYFEYTGDLYPECYYGRFSAENLTDLQPQIDKTLEYEQYLMPDPSFLDEVVMIAGADGTYGQLHGNGQINYGTSNYFNSAHGLLSHTYLQPEPSGGNYSANIRQNVSDGVAYANYTAHCSSSGWADPSFVTSHISALTNASKYPLMIGNCCLSVTFNTDCFGEEILRAQDKGAVGYIGGSNSTYWDEDFWWGVGNETPAVNPVYNSSNLGSYDRTFHDHGEPLAEWYVTQGQMPSAGNLAVTQAGSSLETYYWEIYHLMGDPSLMIYFSQPPVTTAVYNGLMPTGTTDFTVNTNPYAYVAISKDGVLHGAAIANSSGVAEVSLTPIVVPGLADVVVTRQNGQPYIGTVTVASPSGPYVLLENTSIDDATGNNNGEADYDEQLALDVTLENLGSLPATNVIAVLTSTDSYITITDDSSNWPDIPDGNTSTVIGAFTLAISNNVPDQHVAEFDLEITDGSEIWNSTFNITINAPFLEFGNMAIDDNAGGNGNGRLDPGETADITLPVLNNGNSISPSASAMLNSASSYITINSGLTSLGVIGAGGFANAIFNISCDPLTPIGTAVDLAVAVDAGEYDISNTFYKSVGLVLEDWETGNFFSFPWEFAGSADWIIDTSDPYEGTYCAKSGVITHNQTSELVINVETTNDDYISFYRKVSSESNYDYLQFFIDGTQQEQWSGEVAWSEVSYFVSAGVHTFKWIYDKDGSVDTGSDCAWVDYIIFPSIVPPPDPPDIDLSDLSFEVTVPPGGNTTEVLTIANIGEADLDFSLSKYYHPTDGIKAYCTSVGGGGDEYISNVSIGTINNATGQDYYADYTAMSTVVNVGESYPITITNGDPIWTSDQCGIWVDWNQNEDFSDDIPVVVSNTPGVGPYTATITPPVDAMPGLARMRVQIIYSASPDPCLASFSYGEVEDYSLNVNSDFVDWLTLNPVLGTIGDGGSADIDFIFDATELVEGDYYADVTVASNDPNEPSIIIPCTLHVAVGNTISGTISYPNSGTPLNNCTVMLYNDADVLVGQTNTNASGYFELTAVANGNFTMVAICSMPYTYVTTLSDLNIVVSHLLGIPVTGLYFLAAEVSGDGGVGLDDYNLMGSNLLGTLVGYPAVPDFRFENHSVTVSGSDVSKDFGGIMSGDANGDGM